MNFHTLIARNGGRRRENGAGEVSGENRHFPAAGAAADVGGGLGRDAEAEPVLLAPVPTAAAAVYQTMILRILDLISTSTGSTLPLRANCGRPREGFCPDIIKKFPIC
ncbi:hypothetical protein L3X38_041339 [Prunus dulcis]|uniref:Uncharacterized protein n=1 Tax=Prunus dulcis TaxID=3755 RepID=A0AAD4UUK3_PRUDU|nr:hypothetical protein L3X38_041339 [Prunus dulcis]